MSTQTTITYQKPDLSKVSELATFFSKSLCENFSYFPLQAHQHYKRTWTSDNLVHRLQASAEFFLCAFSEEKIVGLILGTPPEGGLSTIVWLMVDPSYQNQKIGKSLLTQATEYYKKNGTHKIKLTVHDKKALRFYLREGFIKEAHHPNHWWNMDFWEVAYFIEPSL